MTEQKFDKMCKKIQVPKCYTKVKEQCNYEDKKECKHTYKQQCTTEKKMQCTNSYDQGGFQLLDLIVTERKSHMTF